MRSRVILNFYRMTERTTDKLRLLHNSDEKSLLIKPRQSYKQVNLYCTLTILTFRIDVPPWTWNRCVFAVNKNKRRPRQPWAYRQGRQQWCGDARNFLNLSNFSTNMKLEHYNIGEFIVRTYVIKKFQNSRVAPKPKPKLRILAPPVLEFGTLQSNNVK